MPRNFALVVASLIGLTVHATTEKKTLTCNATTIDTGLGVEVTGDYVIDFATNPWTYTPLGDFSITVEDRYGRSYLIGNTPAGQDPIRKFGKETITMSSDRRTFHLEAAAANLSTLSIIHVEGKEQSSVVLNLYATATRPAFRGKARGICLIK